ncbi:oligosaccharide flippase family protein [Brevundimonas sp. TSRC1-1]|uniref:oligosaccharide flippase family protein n=1 Tax=Brevundimonas sp. TSRC1-1 TaxID=2804562 RepID=UPI003CF26494
MKSKFSRNLIASILAQLLRYGAPLAFYPYLTRTFGADDFAIFALALAAALMLGQLIEFGFGLSGVRGLAEARTAPIVASEIVGDIVAGRMATLLGVILGSAVAWTWLPPQITDDPLLVVSVALLATGYGFSASWYFIGRERAAHLAGLEIITSFSQLALLLAFVHQGAPPSFAILMMAIPIWAILAFGHVLALEDLSIRWPSLGRLKGKLVESFRFFCFTGALPIMNRASLLVLGAMATPQQVAFYAVGERIVTAAANATIPVVRVIMPRITVLLGDDAAAAQRLFKKTFFGLSSLALVGAVVGAILSPWGVPFAFGEDLRGGALIVAVQLFIVPAMIAGRMIGTLALVPLHREKAYQNIVLVAAFAGLCLAPLAILGGEALGLAVARVLVDTLAAAVCWVVLKRVAGSWGAKA